MREQSDRDIASTDGPRRRTDEVFIVKFSGKPKKLAGGFGERMARALGFGDKVTWTRPNAILRWDLSPDAIGPNPFILRASIPVADGKNSALA